MNQRLNDYTRTVRAYYDDLSRRCRPVSRKEEERLFQQLRKGDESARNKILESNLRFVFDMARKYSGRGVEISELISEGNMGLIKAIDRFDPDKGTKFISYAVWWIRQAMSEVVRKNGVISNYEIGHYDEDEELFDKNSPISDIEDDVEKINSYEPYSDDGDSIRRLESDRVVNTVLLSCLNTRERDVIESYYGIGGKGELTLREIGEKYNLSSERIRQIKKQGFRKLRTKALICGEFDEMRPSN